MIRIERVYDYLEASDKEKEKNGGFSILIDRLWPRGLSKDKVRTDLWLKDIAPSNELRKWFAHDPKKWEEFKQKYKEEIMKDGNKMHLLQQIKQTEKEKGSVIMLYGAKDQQHNNAVALMEFLCEFK